MWIMKLLPSFHSGGANAIENAFLTGSEAPHLLQPYVPAKAVVSCRSCVRGLFVSFSVGAGCVAFIYYLLSREIAASRDRERDALAALARQLEPPPSRKLAPFETPTSIDALLRRYETEHGQSTSSKQGRVLHEEARRRIVHAWNMWLSRIDVTITSYFIERDSKRQEEAQNSLKWQLCQQGKGQGAQWVLRRVAPPS